MNYLFISYGLHFVQLIKQKLTKYSQFAFEPVIHTYTVIHFKCFVFLDMPFIAMLIQMLSPGWRTLGS